MTAHRFTTTGNDQSWRVRGYQDRPRVPGPLEHQMLKQVRDDLRWMPLALALCAIAFVGFAALV